MDKQQLFENIKKKKSFLCVGLDTDIKKIPEHLLKEEDPIFAFNKAIIDATAPYCIAYKPNLAFYESMGVKGWIAFEKTVNYIKENYPDQFIIADAKRGDIVIWGKRGFSEGAFGHVGIMTTTENDPYFISTCYLTAGAKGSAVQEVRYNEFAQRDSYPYYYVYRQM